MGLLLLSPDETSVAPLGPTGTLFALEAEVGLVHVREMLTDVQVAHDGTSTRIARNLRARERLECAFVIDDEQDMRVLRRLRTFNSTAVYYIPIRHEGVTARTNVTGTTVAIDGTWAEWAIAGQRVLIDDGRGENFYTATIQSTSGSGTSMVVTVDVAPSVGTYLAHVAQLVPLRGFYFDDQSPMGRYQVNVGRWNVIMRSERPEPVPLTGVVSTAANVGGLVVLDRIPKIAGLGAEDRPDGGVTLIDYGARVLPRTGRTKAPIYRSHDFRVDGLADIQYWRMFFHTVKGRQKLFLLPTWRDDLPTISVSTDTLTVDDGGEYADYWSISDAQRQVQIQFTNGVIGYYDVLNADVVAGNSEVQLDTNVAAVGTPSVVSFLERVRLATDEMPMEFGTGNQGSLTLGFMTEQA